MKKVTTTIVHFSLPKENIDEFLNSWHQSQEVLIKQPGAIDGICYRVIDDNSPFQVVNVARWESPESLANGLRFYAEEQKKRVGIGPI
jgi:hypothetical protein